MTQGYQDLPVMPKVPTLSMIYALWLSLCYNTRIDGRYILQCDNGINESSYVFVDVFMIPPINF